MDIFGGLKTKEELALVFDIGSSSIGGALFLIEKTGIPKIIYSIREPVSLEKELSFDRFFSLVLKSLEVVSSKICMKGLGAPKKVYCILSSPWYASQTRSIVLNKDIPFIFNSKLVESLITNEVKLFEEECMEKYMHSKNKVIPIELRNMQMTLNGYTILSPSNQKAKELGITIFVSMSAEEVLEKIKEIIGKHFYSRNLKFHSFAIASFAVARDLFIHQDDFLLIDIGGEITDISMIKKDIICSSISFSFGRNFLIRGISSVLDCSLAEASSYVSLYKDGHIEDESLKKIEPVIKKLRDEWLGKFQEALVNLSNDISIPSTIFLTADEDLANFFTETIKSEQFNQYTLTESKFRVVFLGTQTLADLVSFRSDVERDSFLMLEAVYLNQLLHKNKI
jgi:hypothetical protein